MRGEHVIVRAHGDVPLKRRVWSTGSGLVYITNEEQYKLLISGSLGLPPIGFPEEDVYKFEEVSSGLLEKEMNAKDFPWKNLKRWTPS